MYRGLQILYVFCSKLTTWNDKVITYSEEKLDEYVYDLYYAPRDIILDRDELIFEGHDNIDDRRYDYNDQPDWQEDEDSNDEDNWRNEYPDEER